MKRCACIIVSLSILASTIGSVAADAGVRRWKDADLVARYHDLASAGDLRAAVLNPVLPHEPPRAAFLDGLAWFAAGTPNGSGSLTLQRLDEFIADQADLYIRLLESKVENGDSNDYPRSRTWKVIQKMTLLRKEMSLPSRGGRYMYPAISMAPGGDDPWEREHTIGSTDEFVEKVCRASHERPVLVKFGNTNCTQCMLFEMLGSVKEFAEHPAHRESVHVYKVWWGLRPDASFAGKVQDPERLGDLVRTEGVKSSPTFMVYRGGHGYPCTDAYPDAHGNDDRLESCLSRDVAQSAPTGVCASLPLSPASR